MTSIPSLPAVHIDNGMTIVWNGGRHVVGSAHYSGPYDRLDDGLTTLCFVDGTQAQVPATLPITVVGFPLDLVS